MARLAITPTSGRGGPPGTEGTRTAHRHVTPAGLDGGAYGSLNCPYVLDRWALSSLGEDSVMEEEMRSEEREKRRKIGEH